MKTILCTLLAFSLLPFPPARAAMAESPALSVAAPSAILMEKETGEIPWTEEPGRLQSMGSQRVGHY